MKTWERVENLLNIKDMLYDHDAEIMEQERKKKQSSSRMETMRKRNRKALDKGSFEKGNKVHSVVGLRRNKFNNRYMCRVKWQTTLAEATRVSSPIEGAERPSFVEPPSRKS